MLAFLFFVFVGTRSMQGGELNQGRSLGKTSLIFLGLSLLGAYLGNFSLKFS